MAEMLICPNCKKFVNLEIDICRNDEDEPCCPKCGALLNDY